MARVSLKEAYDNKDVVAQIYAIRDIAEGASDTADSAKTTADDAKTYVDTLGVQVEGAVQTANNASASAQTSAETVAGYDARLTEVEGDLNQAESDIDGLETGLGAVTLRVTTAEGNIVTIQGRVTALETADGQNVKINNINAYAVGLTGNQNPIAGNKTWTGAMDYRGSITHTSPYPNIRNVIDGFDITNPSAQQDRGNINWDDTNGVRIGQLRFNILADGRTMIQASVRNSNGTMKYITLAQGDTI